MYRQAYIRNGCPTPTRIVSGPYFDFKSECMTMDGQTLGKKNPDTSRWKGATLDADSFREFFSILLTLDPLTPLDSVGDDNLESVEPLSFVEPPPPDNKFKLTWNTFEPLLMLPRHDLACILPVLTSRSDMACLAGQLAQKASILKGEKVVDIEDFHCKPQAYISLVKAAIDMYKSKRTFKFWVYMVKKACEDAKLDWNTAVYRIHSHPQWTLVRFLNHPLTF